MVQDSHEKLKSKGVEVVYVEYHHEYDYCGFVILTGSRLETDEEYNNRRRRFKKWDTIKK